MGLNISKTTESKVVAKYMNFTKLGNVKINKEAETITLTLLPELFVSQEVKDEGATSLQFDQNKDITLSGDYYTNFMEGCYNALAEALDEDEYGTVESALEE